MDQPGPGRVEDGFEHEEKGDLDGPYTLYAAHQAEVREPDLKDAEIRDDCDVEHGPHRLDRKRPRQTHQERHHVACDHGGTAAVAPGPSRVLGEPAETHQRRRPREAAHRGHDVPSSRVGCGGDWGLGGREQKKEPRSHQCRHPQVASSVPLAEEPGGEDQHVEWCRRLQEDRVGCRGERVGGHVEDHRARVGSPRGQRGAVEVTPCRQGQPEHRCRKARSKARDLPTRKRRELDGGTTGGKE